MKRILIASCIAAAIGIAGCSTAEPIDIDAMGLEKTSPFETPTPQAFTLNAGLYRDTPLGAPAMIPHAIDNYKITPESNPCVMCHGNTANIGKEKVKGMPTAMPKTHWVQAEGKLVMQPSRHECTICHAPQADVKPLVPTTH